MLYTVLNMYDVLKSDEMDKMSVEYKNQDGRIIEYAVFGDKRVVNRLYSTNPYDYLNIDNIFKNCKTKFLCVYTKSI